MGFNGVCFYDQFVSIRASRPFMTFHAPHLQVSEKCFIFARWKFACCVIGSILRKPHEQRSTKEMINNN